MYYGEKTDVTLNFPPELLDVVRDRFGAIDPKSNGYSYMVNATVRVSRTFFAWIAMFEGKVKIIGPQKVKDSYGEFITNLYQSLN